jgi:hypothetical protein
MKAFYNRPFTDCLTLQGRYSMCSEATNPHSGLGGGANDPITPAPGRKFPLGL